MHILLRTDASLAVGTGHVMRCSTLARALVEAGHSVRFLSREIPGHLIPWLEDQGFDVGRLDGEADAPWTSELDAAASQSAIAGLGCDWLVVDHYELDAAWEAAMAPFADRIFAIDDIGRPHATHLLLDPNFPNPTHRLYRDGVPATCEMLMGPRFAPVRPDFPRLRPHSLARRRRNIGRVIIFMGGSDPANETAKALHGIAFDKRTELIVDVIIGGTNPHRLDIETLCASMPDARLHVQTPHMAELMAAADLAICAGGSTTWERCVLGLPALVTILAPNQAPIAEAVATAGGHRLLGRHDDLSAQDYADALAALDPVDLTHMSRRAAEICDGRGTDRVIDRLSQARAAAPLQLDGLHA